MSHSFTTSETTTFTVTHARHMASKLATDLKRIQRFYGSPSDSSISDYEDEVVQLLTAGYLGTVTYGFRRDGQWVEPTLRYTAEDLSGLSANDEDPGRVRPGAEVSGASFHSYLTYSAAWDGLSSYEREAFKKTLPVHRSGAPEPSVNGYFHGDRTYSSGGRALNRASVRSW